MNIEWFPWFIMDNFFRDEIFKEAIDFMEIQIKIKNKLLNF